MYVYYTYKIMNNNIKFCFSPNQHLSNFPPKVTFNLLKKTNVEKYERDLIIISF